MTPEGWELRRVRDFCSRLRRINTAGLDLEPFSITKDRGVILQSEKYNKRIATDPRKYVLAEEGDFAFDPMSLYYGAIGRVPDIGQGLVSPDYVVFKADDTVDSAFLHALLRYPEMHKLYESLSETGNNFGKRRRLYWSIFEDIELTLPPLPEQRKIAAILSSVDDAIESTQAVIEQLGVVKKAMMAELLTRGLPGRHTRFKQTEIGEIPEEWEVVRADAVFAAGPSNGRSPPANALPPGVPTFSISAVRAGEVDISSNLKFAQCEPSTVKSALVRRGDILIVRGNGNAELVGLCGVVNETPPAGCIYPDILMRVEPSRRMAPQFLVPLWNSQVVHDQVQDRAKTTNGTYKINGNDVRSILLPLPSIPEQEVIASGSEALQTQIRINSETAAGLLSLKSALMSVLLTGELRVSPDRTS